MLLFVLFLMHNFSSENSDFYPLDAIVIYFKFNISIRLLKKNVKYWTFPLTLVILGIPVFQINLLDQDVM